MENLKQTLDVVTTPDYVATTHVSRQAKDGKISTESILEIHAKFVVFREKLKKLGFLFEKNEAPGVSLSPVLGKPIRAVSYQIDDINRFMWDERWGKFSNREGFQIKDQLVPSELTLFTVNVLKPMVFNFPHKRSELVDIAFNKSGINSSILRDYYAEKGISYEDAFKILKILKELVVEKLLSAEVPATDENVVHFIALTYFIEHGKSYLGNSMTTRKLETFPEPICEYIYDLIRLKVPLFHSALALSKKTNHPFGAIGRDTKTVKLLNGTTGDFNMPKFSAEYFSQFNEVPELFMLKLIESLNS